MALTDVKNIDIVSEPTLRDALNLHTKEVMMALNCHAIGTIASFDSSKQTVRATINYQKTYFKKQEDGTAQPLLVSYPSLIDVPAIVLGGGLVSLKMPISAGDTCLILFNDRDMDDWISSGQVGQGVATPRLHSFSDGIALVGLSSFNNPWTGYQADKAVLGDDVCSLVVGDTEASLYNGTTAVEVHASKVKIKNVTTTLNTLLQSLCTQLQLLTVTTGGVPSGVPNNAAAIATIATQIAGLLE